MSTRWDVISFALRRYLTVRIQVIILAPRTLTRAQPLALLPVRPEDQTPLAENFLVSHDSLPF